jgi:ribonuclease M5
MINIREAIIVEGIYDKMKLEQFVDAAIFPTNGFALFRDKEKMELIRQLAQKRGIIILTDSDRAGFRIRSHIQSFVPKEQIKHAYIPEILGKERRKASPGKEGLLGVEGVSEEIILHALQNAGCRTAGEGNGRTITKLDLYRDGLAGKQDSSIMRSRLLKELSLPSRLSSNALLDMLNALFSFEEYKDYMAGFLERQSIPSED